MSLKDCIDKRSGFVPLWRDGWQDWDWFEDDNTYKVFMYFYQRANYKARTYQGTKIERGQFVTSLGKIAEALGLTVQNVRTAINKLKSTNDIECEGSRKGLTITVKNYDWLINDDNFANTKVTRNQHDANTKVTTNNKVYKENNVVVDAEAPTTNFSDNNFLRFWNLYVKKREKYKKDTFDYWMMKKYTSQEVEQILNGARMYSDEMRGDKCMVYARSFLEDEIWKRYVDDAQERRKQNALKEQQAQLEWLKSQGVELK